MNAVVVYASRYGSTEKYAKWIAEALSCEAKKVSEVKAADLDPFDTLVYGGGLYAGSIAGFQKFLSMLSPNDPKRLALFMVGMTDTGDTQYYLKTAQQNLPVRWKDRFAVYAFRGDQMYSKMGAMHRLVMRAPLSAAKRKSPDKQTEEDLYLIEHFGEDILLADRGAILPLVDYLREGDTGA